MDAIRHRDSSSHALLNLPDEILLQITFSLQLRDILALRATCIRLSDLTRDRSVWLHILRQQQQHLPLPHHISRPSSWVRLSAVQLEATVRLLHSVDRTWLFPRTNYFVPGHRQSCALDPIFDHDDGARSIYSIDIFLDRWLLCIYHEKLVEIWDLDSVLQDPYKPILCTSHNVKGVGSFTSAITHLDEHSDLLTVAVSCHELCEVLQVQLRPSSALNALDDLQDIDDIVFLTTADVAITSPVLCLRAVYPSQSLLLLSLPSTFHLFNWETGQQTIVHMFSEEEEELWNGVVGATFLTSRHILVLKAHSIELCTLIDTLPKQQPAASRFDPGKPRPSETHMCAVVHSHYLPSTTFRGASFAQPAVHTTSHHPGSASLEAEPTKVSTSFLAFDVLRGLFHFSVEVTLPLPAVQSPDDAPTPIDVHIQLLASHNMALPIFPPPPVDGIATPTPTIPRSGFSYGTRGFVSACALGPAGRRGVWVERRRGAVRRVVYGFDAVHPGPPRDNDDSLRGGETPASGNANTHNAGSSVGDEQTGVTLVNALAGPVAAIDGREVYDVNSYDLRDDITHIAFAEATGLIALGTRKGEIRVLGRPEES